MGIRALLGLRPLVCRTHVWGRWFRLDEDTEKATDATQWGRACTRCPETETARGFLPPRDL